MPDERYFLAPVKFFATEDFLSGRREEALPTGTELVTDLAYAMTLENDQLLPQGYRIWADVLSAAVSPFYSTAEGKAGRTIIDQTAEQIWATTEAFQGELRKKKLRKTITAFEEFYLTVSYDCLEQLKSVSLGRFVHSDGVEVLERIFSIYLAGFYPCGARTDGNLVAFDVRVLR